LNSSKMNNSTAATPPIFFGYFPDLNLAIVSFVLYLVVVITVTAITVRFKKWSFLILSGAGFADCIGWALRMGSTQDPNSLPLYIAMTLFILLPPTIAATVNYSLLSQVMIDNDIKHPLFTPKRVKWVFLGVDVSAFILQLFAGGAMAVQSMANIGRWGIVAGLAISLLCFFFFLCLCVYIHIKAEKAVEGSRPYWHKIFIALYINMVMLVIRSVFRLAEFAPGYHSAIALNEPLFYGLDALPILLVYATWIPLHPGFIFPRTKVADVKGDKNEVTVSASYPPTA